MENKATIITAEEFCQYCNDLITVSLDPASGTYIERECPECGNPIQLSNKPDR